MVAEIDRTLGASKKVTLPNDQVFFGNNSLSKAQQNYDKLSGKVDLVLLVGSISTKGALQNKRLNKPTIAIGVIDPNLQELPYQNGTSGKYNFSYIWANKDVFKELSEFRRLVGFKELAVLVNASSALTVNTQKGKRLLDSLGKAFSAKVSVVPIGDNITTSLNALPSKTDAVYLTHLYGKTSADITAIASELKKRKLPSFSGSQWHVKRGILGSNGEENDLRQVIRRLSLMVDDALSGSALAKMRVSINFKQSYSLNVKTAREIGLSPAFDVLFTANLIDEDKVKSTTYSLTQILDQSLQKNLDIKLAYKDIELTSQDIVLARSSVLPNVSLDVSAVQLNPDQGSFISPERQGNAQLSLTQVIYSEEAVAAIRIAKYINEAQKYQTQANVLTVLINTYEAYFNVLSAKTDLLIQQENLRNSLKNLEIAKVKISTGASSKADALRWESEVAASRQAVVQSETTVMSAKFRLNNLLANTLEQDFDIADITIEGDIFKKLSEDRISKLITRPSDFSSLSNFLVTEAVRSNPNKKQLLENLKAIERTQLQNKRLFYVPTIAIQASAGYVFHRSGNGSEGIPGFNLVDNPWQVALSLSYPIFVGNQRRANLQKSHIQLDQIKLARTQLDQSLELQVRTSLLTTLSASTNINFSQLAAQNALENFELVRNNYQQGAATITQLIDAQRAALNAQLSNALSIYNFILAKLRVEFAIGFFSMLTPEQQLKDFEDRFEKYLNAKD
ncbi:TolC family protein [uncultured Microscilla sp.]|uniref:TolC family protein n=1 Tax=uncultured Microscilla sp. TaxID=432653 RepID=UPI002627D79B|nr:TolC family protein [uncultured Microscilla sp.]